MATSTKVFDLAKANIKQKDEEKAITALKRTVRNANTNWNTDVNSLRNHMDEAQDNVDALSANPNATLAQCLEANQVLRLAKADLAEAEELMAARF